MRRFACVLTLAFQFLAQPLAIAEVQEAQSPDTTGKEILLEVKAKKHLIHKSSATSSTSIAQEQIQQTPGGSEVSLAKLLTTTTPGVIAGPFNQTFFRGNHANVQYQIDGVQLPDSPSGSFSEAISPRNIDHMEVITGGIPAQYGQRLAAVINMVTKSGEEKPGGEIELNYGSYDSFSPHAIYGGSSESGALHYFASANYRETRRGLDTPQPASLSNSLQGGSAAIHDQANGNNEFFKLDWLMDNSNKFTAIVSQTQNHFQIPNFPGSFQPTDSIFQSSYVDRWGNSGFTYVRPYTNDYQDEANAYVQGVWKHSFSDRSFLQVAPYFKYSYLHFQNDPNNDLAFPETGTPNSAASFYESRNTQNLGLKADYTRRLNEQHELKAGLQAQSSRSTGTISVQTQSNGLSNDTSPESATYLSAYVQDDWLLNKQWSFNLGLRYDFTQFAFADASPSDGWLQPRVGVNYMVTETTKLHAFYGRLFQPAPAEDLRDTFINTGSSACQAGRLCPYDIRAEKDDYFEIGVAQQFNERQVALLNVYYKTAQNMLDDNQLLNTAIAQPYNLAKGYAYGVELSLKGEFANHWSEFFNYSYDIAKGYGMSGGFFAFTAPQANAWRFLDHVQIHTANAGVTYAAEHLWWTLQGLYGSGLRTGPNNGSNLPGHLTFDTTVGYKFTGDNWWARCKVAVDVLNILNDAYPITIANGFNGSHYAAGQQFFVHYIKEI
jgi:outer membrane receptor protein involved in Fe transport